MWKKRACDEGRDRNSIHFHASAWCFEAANSTRLDPPAVEYPLACPVGPGMGAVAHAFLSESGMRFLNSSRFHGPVTYMANEACANSWYRFEISLFATGAARPSLNRLT